MKEFESGIGVMIAINAVLMGFEVDLAKTGDIGWIIVENFFCILWITEMLLKLRALRLEYFWSPFNVRASASRERELSKGRQMDWDIPGVSGYWWSAD